MGKIKICGLLLGGLFFLMTSCLDGDDTDVDNWRLGNAQIASFSLSHDSIEALANVKFTIDQINGKIYNKDSMPFGTVLYEKVLCEVSFDESSLGVAGILFIEQSGDSIWSTSDSIDFAAPVSITVYPYDGVSTKTYEAKVNIHQVNPDTMVWQGHSGLVSGHTFQDMKVIAHGDRYYMYTQESGAYSLYQASVADVKNWEKQTLTGFPEKAVLSQIVLFEGTLYILSDGGDLFYSSDRQTWLKAEGLPPITTLIGSLPKNTVNGRPAVLAGITTDDGVSRYIALTENRSWEVGTIVPDAFPVSGFSGLDYELMYHTRLVIASGRMANDDLSDKAWTTMDGLSWAPLSVGQQTFSAREGASIAFYDDRIFLFGGIDADGAALNDIYFSKDNGITWATDTIYMMPEDYQARGFSSICVDKNNYILLFGGKAGSSTPILNELWRGRINRLGFGKD